MRTPDVDLDDARAVPLTHRTHHAMLWLLLGDHVIIPSLILGPQTRPPSTRAECALGLILYAILVGD